VKMLSIIVMGSIFILTDSNDVLILYVFQIRYVES